MSTTKGILILAIFTLFSCEMNTSSQQETIKINSENGVRGVDKYGNDSNEMVRPVTSTTSTTTTTVILKPHVHDDTCAHGPSNGAQKPLSPAELKERDKKEAKNQ